MTVVTPADRPKSVRNRNVIELFGDVFVLSCCSFDISVGITASVIGPSQISSFFSVMDETRPVTDSNLSLVPSRRSDF